MLRWILVSGLAWIGMVHVFAQPALSSGARVSLLTYGPGNEWNSVWGHTAIRISDPASQTDRVYNYGYADFQDPWYYVKMAFGKLDYWVEPITFHETMFLNKLVKRTVDEQVLDLTYREKTRLFEALEDNCRTENRKYKYDYYTNNCTSKSVDIILANLEGELIYEKELADMTLRDFIDIQTRPIPWARFVINLISGYFIDQKVDYQTVMFLPRNVFDYFGSARIIRNGRATPLVSSSQNILYHEYVMPDSLFWTSPYLIFGVLLVFELLLFALSWYFRKQLLLWYDKLWLILANVAGFVFLLFWIFSEQKTVQANFDFLWLSPFLFVVLFLKKPYQILFFKVLAVISAFVLVFGSFLLPQITPVVVLPLTAIMLLKYLKFGFLKYRFS